MGQIQATIDGLYYIKSESVLLYIPSKYTNGGGDAGLLIKNIQEGIDFLRQFCPNGAIHTREIQKSSWCRWKWYFTVYCDKCPKQAFELGNDWTMMSWIQR